MDESEVQMGRWLLKLLSPRRRDAHLLRDMVPTCANILTSRG